METWQGVTQLIPDTETQIQGEACGIANSRAMVAVWLPAAYFSKKANLNERQCQGQGWWHLIIIANIKKDKVNANLSYRDPVSKEILKTERKKMEMN